MAKLRREPTDNPWRWISLGADMERISRFVGLPAGTSTWRSHRFTVWICSRGRATVQLLDEAVHVESGFMLLIPADVQADIRPDEQQPWDVFACEFDLLVFSRPLQNLRRHVRTNPLSLSAPGLPTIGLKTKMDSLAIGERIIRARQKYHDTQMAMIEVTVQLWRLLHRLRLDFAQQGGIESTIRPLSQRAVHYVYNQTENPNARLSDIAEHVGLSVSQLVRDFRRFTGTSPMRFLQQQRMVRARQLLQHPDFRINEIAKLCGFKTPQLFSSTFKAHHGLTPREFRKQQVYYAIRD